MPSSSPEKELERLLQALLPETPWVNLVFSVGGFVRDDLLGIESKDLDLVIEQPSGSEKLSFWIKEQFSEEVSHPYRIGAAYPIWHLRFLKDIIWKGQTFKTAGAEVDIADTQREAFQNTGLPEFGTISQDILRRDFTVNMLLRDLTSGKIEDPTGVSLSDLREGILRGHPQVDIHKTFEADPLRMIRVLRFKLKYDWKIHPEVIEGVKNCRELIQRVSWERIRDELIVIAEYGRLGSAIEWMDQVGLLEFIFPEVMSMKGVEQDTLHHSEGDVFVHTLLLLQKANPGIIPQFSALLHDVGKPQTQTVHLPKKEGEVRRIKFLDHENVGAKMSEEILRRLKFENSVIEKVSKIVRFHLRAHFSKDWSAKAVRKFARDCGEELGDILHVSEIDSLSSYGLAGLPKENLIPDLRKQLGKAIQIPIRKRTVLTGEEVMGLLNLSPGKSVGEALLLLQDIEDEYAVRGEPLSSENAIRLLKERYSERRMK